MDTLRTEEWLNFYRSDIERFFEEISDKHEEPIEPDWFFHQFNGSLDKKMSKMAFFDSIWLYCSSNYYDACQGVDFLRWEELVETAGAEESVYRDVLQGIFPNALLPAVCEFSSSYCEAAGEEVKFTWCGVDYCWIFQRCGDSIDTDVYKNIFKLMAQTTETCWRYTFQEPNAPYAQLVLYGVLPLWLSVLIEERFLPHLPCGDNTCRELVI